MRPSTSTSPRSRKYPVSWALVSPASVSRAQAKAQRRKPEDMVTIVEDTLKLLEGVEEAYRHGRHPDAKVAKPTAKVLRALADELDL